MPNLTGQLRGFGRHKPTAGSDVNFTHPQAVGLAGYFPFLASGTTNAINYGTSQPAIFTTTGTPTWVAGAFGRPAPSLVDSNSVFSNAFSPTGFSVNNPLSMSLWMNYPTTSPAHLTGVLGVSASSGAGSFISIGRVAGKLGVEASGGSYYVSINCPAAGVWHHVVFVWDGTTNYLYVDGVLQTTSTTAHTAGTCSQLWLGGFNNGFHGAAYGYNGQADDVRLYTRALSAGEVTSIYTTPWALFKDEGIKRLYHYSIGSLVPTATSALTAGRSFAAAGQFIPQAGVTNSFGTNLTVNHPVLAYPVATGLVGYWKLDDATGDSHVDSSGNGLTLTDQSLTQSTTIKVPLAYPNTSAAYTGATGGSSAYIDTTISPGSAIRTITLTYVFWFYPLNISGNYTIGGYNGGSSHAVVQWNDGTVSLRVSGVRDLAKSTTTVNLNAWNFLAASYDQASGACYLNLNGAVVTRSETAGTNPWGTPGALWKVSISLPGYIDEFRFYNRALSTAEINVLAVGNYLPYTMGSYAVVFRGNMAINVTPPTFSASAVGSATFTGSMTTSSGNATITSSATCSIPVYTGNASMTSANATITASSQGAAVYTGNASLTATKATVSASSHEAAIFTGNASVTTTHSAFSASSTRKPLLIGSTINRGFKDMILIKLSESAAARRRVPFDMVALSDNVTPGTGLTFAATEIKVYQNGGSEANYAGTVTEIGGGLYYYEFTAGEIGTLGQLTIRIVKSGYNVFKAVAQVVSFDPYDAVRIGLTSLPSASPAQAGGLPTVGTGPGQINVGSGVVDINLGQGVTARDLTSVTTQNIGDCLSAARADGAGKWVFAGTSETIYAPDGTTVVRTFTLNDAINPTQRI